jgi:hypothetical protein
MATPTKGMALEDFLKIATPEQHELLIDIGIKMADAADREERLWKEIEKHQDRATSYDNLKIGHEYEHMALRESAESLDRKMDKLRAEIAGYLQTLVDNGMANLGIVQRQYESYTGKKLPK